MTRLEILVLTVKNLGYNSSGHTRLPPPRATSRPAAWPPAPPRRMFAPSPPLDISGLAAVNSWFHRGFECWNLLISISV